MCIFTYIALWVCIDLDISVNNKTFLMTTEMKEKKKKNINKIFFLPSPAQSNPSKERCWVENLIQIG